MSSILKALRKIDEEKRVTKHVAPDLRVDQGLAPVKPRYFLPLFCGVALGAVMVALFFVWPSSNPGTVTKIQPVPKREKAIATVQPLPQPSAVAQKERAVVSADQSLNASVETSSTPVVSLPSKPVALFDKSRAIKSVPATKVTADQQKISDPLISSNIVRSSPSTTTVKVSPAVSSVLPEGVSLLVTEIFYQEESANSMAVVNDLPVMVGTRVDSAVVVEIQPESVHFKIGDIAYVVRPAP